MQGTLGDHFEGKYVEEAYLHFNQTLLAALENSCTKIKSQFTQKK